jgi:hypothetical protein
VSADDWAAAAAEAAAAVAAAVAAASASSLALCGRQSLGGEKESKDEVQYKRWRTTLIFQIFVKNDMTTVSTPCALSLLCSENKWRVTNNCWL